MKSVGWSEVIENETDQIRIKVAQIKFNKQLKITELKAFSHQKIIIIFIENKYTYHKCYSYLKFINLEYIRIAPRVASRNTYKWIVEIMRLDCILLICLFYELNIYVLYYFGYLHVTLRDTPSTISEKRIVFMTIEWGRMFHGRTNANNRRYDNCLSKSRIIVFSSEYNLSEANLDIWNKGEVINICQKRHLNTCCIIILRYTIWKQYIKQYWSILFFILI